MHHWFYVKIMNKLNQA